MGTVAATGDARSDVRVTSLIAGGHFFSHFYILALPPLFPVLHQELGLSMTSLGLLIASLNMTTLLVQPPIGVLVDRIGPGTILIMGQLVFACAMALVGIAPVYLVLMALMVLAGLGNAVYHPADYAILSARVGQQRMARAFSIHTFGGYAGFAAAPIVMVTLTELFGWRTALVVVGLLGIAMGLVLAACRQDLEVEVVDKRAADRQGTDRRLWTSAPVLLSLLFFFLLAMSHAGFTSFGVVILVRLFDLDLVDANLPIAGYLVLSAAGVLVGGWLADRTGRFALIVASSTLVIALVAAATAAFRPSYAVLFVLFLAAGFASGTIAPSRDMLVRAVTPQGASGRVFGFVMVGFNIGGLVAPPLYGLLVDHGQAGLVLWVVAGFSLLTLVTVVGTSPRQTAEADAAATA